MIEFTVYEYIANETDKKLVTVDKEGVFSLELQIPYPQHVLMNGPFMAGLFLIPGDTLVFMADYEKFYENRDDAFAFWGNNDAAQVNRHMDAVKKKFDIRHKIINVDSFEKALELRDILLDKIDNVLASAGDSLVTLPLSGMAKDIIVSSLIFHEFSDILTVYQNYIVSTMPGSNGLVVFAERDSAGIEKREFFDFAKKYYDVLFDNELILTAAVSWIPFNYACFNIVDDFSKRGRLHTALYDCIDKIREWDADAADIDKEDVIFYRRYDSALVRATQAMDRDSLFCSFGQMYDSLYAAATDCLGIGNCFLFQAAGTQMLGLKNETSMDNIIELVSCYLPHAENRVVRRALLDYVRAVVRETEGGIVADDYPRVTEFFNGLNSRYPGEFIVLDFWSLSCGPCCSGMINQRELVKKYAGKVRFVYVSSMATERNEDVNAFFEKNEIKGENVRVSGDLWMMLASKFNISAIPHVEILTPEGNIYKKGNYFMGEYLIEKILSEHCVTE